MRRLVEREALEVAEDHRQAERTRQPPDLVVQRLGLLTRQDRSFGRAGRTRAGIPQRVDILDLAAAATPDPGLPRRAQGHPVEPVAQQVGVADRAGLARQDEEDGLEGVLGVVSVAQELPANAQHHRAMAGYERGEGGLADGIAAGDESIEELAVGQPGDRAAIEQRAELPDHRRRHHLRHARGSLEGKIEAHDGDRSNRWRFIPPVLPRWRSFYPGSPWKIRREARSPCGSGAAVMTAASRSGCRPG